MKTIQFTGTENNIENLHLALGISDNDMPQQSETRVYIVKVGLTKEGITDEDYLIVDDLFMIEAERQGTVYTLDEFTRQFNDEEITVNNSIQYIRIINVTI
jgi:hypothetical protein